MYHLSKDLAENDVHSANMARDIVCHIQLQFELLQWTKSRQYAEDPVARDDGWSGLQMQWAGHCRCAAYCQKVSKKKERKKKE